MPDVASTQEELITREVQQDLFRRGMELMRDAAEAGFVMNLGMHTALQKDNFGSRDSLSVAPYRGNGRVLLHPDPKINGPYR